MPSLKDLEPVIARVCTERQWHELALTAAGYTLAQGGDVLGVWKVTFRDHLRAGIRNIQRELERQSL
jgi:hypothetical protein